MYCFDLIYEVQFTVYSVLKEGLAVRCVQWRPLLACTSLFPEGRAVASAFVRCLDIRLDWAKSYC